MTKQIKKTLCYLVPEDGQHILYDTSGNAIPGLTCTVVRDHMEEEHATCDATLIVNICSKEEMQKAIKKENMVEVNLQQPIHVQTAKKSRIWGWK